jgi:two-component system sensor kinase FixL
MLLALRQPDAPWSGWLVAQCPPDLFGFPYSDEIITSGELAARIHPDDRGAFDAVRVHLQETGSACWSYRIRHADGRYRWTHEEWLRIGGADDDCRLAACVLVTGPRRLPAWLKERASERLYGFVAGCRHSLASGPGEDRLSNVPHGVSDKLRDCESEIRRLKETLELEIAQRTTALRDSETRFRTLSEATFEGVMLSRAGIIQDCNEQLAAILGYKPAEIIGRRVSDFVPPDWRERVRQAITEGRESAFEHQALCKDGGYRVVETRGRSPDGANGLRLTAIRDVTESKLAEIALRESEMRFRQLAEVAPDGIAITEDARIVDGNAQLAAMSGWELKELIGRSIWDFIPEHAREVVAERLREDSSPVYESHVLRKDGSEIPVEVSGRTMLWQGKPRRVTLLRDLTAARQAADQMEALRSALERGRRLAEISEISAAVVHQLGQPFTAITANVSALLNLLSQGRLQQDCAEETLRAVEAGLRNVREIMSHLRTLIHPDQAEREPVDLGQVVSEVLRVLRTEAEQRKVFISFDSAPGLPLVCVDRVQISQLVFNLIRNAFDAVAACPVERRQVDVSTGTVDGRSVRMTVRDLGGGIASELKPRIFDAYFTTKPDGMGMGLRISRTIVETHGGSLKAENNPDGPGASFTVELPIDQEPARREPHS